MTCIMMHQANVGTCSRNVFLDAEMALEKYASVSVMHGSYQILIQNVCTMAMHTTPRPLYGCGGP
jgi:hypothetical protein